MRAAVRCNMQGARQSRLYTKWMACGCAAPGERAHVKTPRLMLRRGVRVEWLPRFHDGDQRCGKG
jgi:hypothetical protein